ncbi:MAG: cyclic 2,3-diphosphoglycerate synthase [bacterium]
MAKKKVVIMGAAGRDFHNFNEFFRDNEDYEVVAFTATQIPHSADRIYPASLAGRLYPDGIPIKREEDLNQIIEKSRADVVVFAYSDVKHTYVMHKASQVIASGADYWLMGAESTWISSGKPLVSVCAVRTGCGKSQTTRRVCEILEAAGRKTVVIRHPMPYGDLAEQAVQRFATHEDLDIHECTIEEREEYEPHIDKGRVVYAGVDYGAILREAEKEADVVVWDGGNNDLPFYRPDLQIVVVDPLRPGDELEYHPGEANFRMADVFVINKVDTASKEGIDTVKRNIAAISPNATVIEAESPISVEDPGLIKGKRVLVIEDGPTLTHGGMEYGAGMVAARKFGAAECIDPHPFAVGEIVDTLEKYTHIKDLVPAMGYGEGQVRDLEATINASGADIVLSGTPIDITRVIETDIPVVRVTYDLKVVGKPDLGSVLESFLS